MNKNIFCVENDEIKKKLGLILMSKQRRNHKYKLKDNARSRPRRIKVIYKGKEYASMTSLAAELGLDLSTVSKHYKRHNGDLSTLGSYSR